MQEPLSFSALGPLEVRRGVRPLDLGPPLRRSLLALLLHALPNAVPVDRLADQLWPEGAPRDPVRNLQVHVSALRGALGPGVVLTEGRAYRLHVASSQVDRCRFEADADAARRLLDAGRYAEAWRTAERALALWRGDAWGDARHLPALEPDAFRLEERRVDVTVTGLAARMALGRHRELVAELEEWVRREPLREDLWEQLVLALHRSGRQADALKAYARAREHKVGETGLEPGPGLRDLQRRVLADDPSLGVEDAELRRRRRIPAPTTALVGRDEQTAELVALVRSPGCRLLTLTGPGGVGKTRLALSAAHQLAADFADGVWFIGLAEVRDPAVVARTVAEALEVEDVEGDALGALRAHLRGRRLLLVLDNFEQVESAAPVVSELLAAADGLHVLVTSRTRLRVYGEHVRAVEPLPREAAVSLFVARAREVAPWFDGSPAEAIGRVCEALDGIPLALELVAARADDVTLGAMLEQLDDRLGLASDGPRDRSDRQRSLRGAIAWSVELLPTRHQEVFGRLGVFLGGFTPAAAADVAEADPEVLADLVRVNLLRADPTGRHDMLETIREYAVERLGEELPVVASAHADWFLAVAED
ncbi:MAG TPA: BTAD domain-containing putative transcriptional regulator, partial [Nocardioides sp.]|nr:BTAD domain-containing putative transcriptional regulator [Nocardioides sp.]